VAGEPFGVRMAGSQRLFNFGVESDGLGDGIDHHTFAWGEAAFLDHGFVIELNQSYF
jgi:hypothetical protein